jgi:hypothetical protein
MLPARATMEAQTSSQGNQLSGYRKDGSSIFLADRRHLRQIRSTDVAGAEPQSHGTILARLTSCGPDLTHSATLWLDIRSSRFGAPNKDQPPITYGNLQIPPTLADYAHSKRADIFLAVRRVRVGR